MIVLDEAEELIYNILNQDLALKTMLNGGKVSRKLKPQNSKFLEVVVIGIAGGESAFAMQNFIINVNTHVPVINTSNGVLVDSKSQTKITKKILSLLKNHYSSNFNCWNTDSDNDVTANESIATIKIQLKYISNAN